MAEAVVHLLAREREAAELLLAVDVVDDELLAVGRAAPVAVARRAARASRRARPRSCMRSAPRLEVLRPPARSYSAPPRVLAAPRQPVERLQVHAGPHGRRAARRRPPARRGTAASAPARAAGRRARPARPGRAGGGPRRPRRGGASASTCACAQRRRRRPGRAAASIIVQALERVLAVEDAGLVGALVLQEVDAPAERAVDRRAADEHGHVEPARVELVQAQRHLLRGRDEQRGEADGVGADLDGLVDDDLDRHLPPEVEGRVAVVGEDRVDEALADVVHVAEDRGQHDLALRLALLLVEVGLQLARRRAS